MLLRPVRSANGEASEFSSLDHLLEGDHGTEGNVHFCGRDTDHRRAFAFVRDLCELDARLHPKAGASQMRRASGPAVAMAEFLGIRFPKVNQFLEALERGPRGHRYDEGSRVDIGHPRVIRQVDPGFGVLKHDRRPAGPTRNRPAWPLALPYGR